MAQRPRSFALSSVFDDDGGPSAGAGGRDPVGTGLPLEGDRDEDGGESREVSRLMDAWKEADEQDAALFGVLPSVLHRPPVPAAPSGAPLPPTQPPVAGSALPRATTRAPRPPQVLEDTRELSPVEGLGTASASAFVPAPQPVPHSESFSPESSSLVLVSVDDIVETSVQSASVPYEPPVEDPTGPTVAALSTDPAVLMLGLPAHAPALPHGRPPA